MKKLAIDLKDNYAAIAASGEFGPVYLKIDFGDFAGDQAETRLVDIAGDRFRQLYLEAEKVSLVIPMRYSLAKIIEIDRAGIEKYGDDFLNWEASLQLPSELGDFRRDFYRLGESFDKKRYKYFFCATPQEFIRKLEEFASIPGAQKLQAQSEAMALYHALNLAADFSGLDAAISLEPEGASVVLSHDGDYLGGRYIRDNAGSLRDELMYFIIGTHLEDLRPKLLLSGDLNLIDKLGDLSWAETLKLDIENGLAQAETYAAAIGLNLML